MDWFSQGQRLLVFISKPYPYISNFPVHVYEIFECHLLTICFPPPPPHILLHYETLSSCFPVSNTCIQQFSLGMSVCLGVAVPPWVAWKSTMTVNGGRCATTRGPTMKPRSSAGRLVTTLSGTTTWVASGVVREPSGWTRYPVMGLRALWRIARIRDGARMTAVTRRMLLSAVEMEVRCINKYIHYSPKVANHFAFWSYLKCGVSYRLLPNFC